MSFPFWKVHSPDRISRSLLLVFAADFEFRSTAASGFASATKAAFLLLRTAFFSRSTGLELNSFVLLSFHLWILSFCSLRLSTDLTSLSGLFQTTKRCVAARALCFVADSRTLGGRGCSAEKSFGKSCWGTENYWTQRLAFEMCRSTDVTCSNCWSPLTCGSGWPRFAKTWIGAASLSAFDWQPFALLVLRTKGLSLVWRAWKNFVGARLVGQRMQAEWRCSDRWWRKSFSLWFFECAG